MKGNIQLIYCTFLVVASQVVFGQCAITLGAISINPTCCGCTNGTVSVIASGGTAPYTYSWTNNISGGTADIILSKNNSIYEQTMTNSNGTGDYLVAGGLFNANESKEFNIAVFQNGGGSGNGAITLTKPGLSGRTITAGNTQPNDNANWTISTVVDGTVTAVYNPGQVVEKNGFRLLGFTAVRKATTPSGTNQNLSADVSGGGDVTPGNNSQSTIFSAN